MWQRVTQLDTGYKHAGTHFVVTIEGLERPDGTWAGRIVFTGGATSRATDQETSQPNRKALEYWATGIEPIYLEGAFGRSSALGPRS